MKHGKEQQSSLDLGTRRTFGQTVHRQKVRHVDNRNDGPYKPKEIGTKGRSHGSRHVQWHVWFHVQGVNIFIQDLHILAVATGPSHEPVNGPKLGLPVRPCDAAAVVVVEAAGQVAEKAQCFFLDETPWQVVATSGIAFLDSFHWFILVVRQQEAQDERSKPFTFLGTLF